MFFKRRIENSCKISHIRNSSAKEPPGSIDIIIAYSRHVEAVVLLSKVEIDSKKVRVKFSLEGMDMSGYQNDATHGQIKERVLE